MRPRSRAIARAVVLAALAGCTTADAVGPGSSYVDPPFGLVYELVPSGDPYEPEGIVLTWDAPNDSRIASFVVYSRGSTGAGWSRRAETTSYSFHDTGLPHLQYFVASMDDYGNESAASNVVTVDERNRLTSPASLTSTSLDRAVQLAWSANARLADPDGFDYYRVYSTTYSLDANVCAAAYWVLEGTTISEDFLVSGLPNGAARCFAVSAVSRDGHESLWSELRADTPRPDARNEFLYARQANASLSGFRFEDPASGALGIVLAGDRTDLDFRIERASDGTLYIEPVRSDVVMALYSTEPVEDLTSIDIAPVRSAFSRTSWEAVAGYAYVFEMRLADGLHYGALRVTHVGADYVIFDWAYQTDAGNPELVVMQMPPKR
jgi:hypothetical protein